MSVQEAWELLAESGAKLRFDTVSLNPTFTYVDETERNEHHVWYLDGVTAYVNFAGGHGGHRNGKPNTNCSPDALVAAAAHYGRTVRRPMLWIYTENDTYFGPQLSRRMFAAFGKAGGRARFELLPPLRTERTQDGHDLLFVGRDIWEPIVFPWLDANAK